VVAANVVGMSQHADGGLMATKPYASGGAHLDRMAQPLAGRRRLRDLDELVAQARERGTARRS